MQPQTVCERLRAFLDENDVRYVSIGHSPAFTAQELAARVHVPGRSFVKSVMVRADGKHYQIALSANQRLDLDRIRNFLGVDDVHLETEDEFRNLFPDCELGAMPPFGNLYGVPVIAERSLWDDDVVAFNAGNHRYVIQMDFDDYVRLARPIRAWVASRPAVATT